MGRLSEWALNLITWVFIRERLQRFHANTHRKEGEVKMEEKLELCDHYVKKCWLPSETGKDKNGF